MENRISPKYLMRIISEIEDVLWNLFPTNKYKNVRFYIEKWHESNDSYDWNSYWENFKIFEDDGKIDLSTTLHNIDENTLIKIAIDLGIDTPDFLPSIPVFRNEIKASYQSASETFESAFRKIETEPDIAIGLANSALESIIKEILKDERISSQIKPNKTLYDLASEILKVFQFFPNSDMPIEIKTIGSSLLTASQSIEKLRSDKTIFHGKTSDDYRIDESIYTYFVVNCVTTVGLFLKSYYRTKFPEAEVLSVSDSSVATNIDTDDLPF